MRRAATLLLLLAFWALPAHAEEPAAPAVDPADWELLPVTDLERQELAQKSPELVRQALTLGARLKKLEQHRAARANPDDSAGRGLGRQAEDLRKRLAPVLAKVLALRADEAVDERLLAHIARAPKGPRRTARYAASLSTFVEGLPEEVRALLEYVTPRFDGALLTLDREVRAARAAQGKGTQTAEAVQRRAAALEADIRALEKRYWRLVDYVLPEAQRVALHRRLPSAYQQHETVFQHLYALPGLTASQGTRIRAVIEEVQAQASPDNALVKRLHTTMQDIEDKRAAREEIQAAQKRLVELQRWASDEGKRILSPAQWAAYEAIPPRVSAQDRKATSVQILEKAKLSAAQRRTLQRMRDELSDYRALYRKRKMEAAGRMAGMGPDSPQMAGAQMAMATVEADANLVQRRFNGRVFLELLTPDQVVHWVIGPPRVP